MYDMHSLRENAVTTLKHRFFSSKNRTGFGELWSFHPGTPRIYTDLDNGFNISSFISHWEQELNLALTAEPLLRTYGHRV